MLHIHNIFAHNQHTKSCEDTVIACDYSNVIRRVADHAGRLAEISSPATGRETLRTC